MAYLAISPVPLEDERRANTEPQWGKKAFKSDSDRREKVDHQRALFKMAVPSTSTTPSPTTAAAFVTQIVTATLLAVTPSPKPRLEV